MAVEWKKVVLESSSGNVSQNAATATALATARGLQVDLAETDASNFDGTGAVTDIGVSGTLAVTNGGTGIASIPKGSLLQATADDTILALSGGSGDNGKVVSYNSTTDLFELVATGTATNATNVTVTDNESTNENNLITFVADAGDTTGSHALEMDGNLTYNPFTGNLSATQLTGTLQTAAQTNITSVGALNGGSITSGFGAIDNGSSAITTTGAITGGSLTVDDVAVDGKVITMTGSSGDTATLTAGTNGTLDIVTTDAVGAAANIQITADGTAELAGTTVTLDSSGGITLDADGGTITFADAGASLGTITSSGYSGTAAVATTVTITDNENTNENNPIVFVAGADTDGGNLGLETDGDAHYNPSTGTITATAFAGNLTGNVTGSADTVATSASSSSDAHFIAMFANASGDQAPVTDAGLKYTPSSDTLTVSNLTVSGTTTTVNTSDLEVTDKIIRVANNGTNAATVALAGMEIDTEDGTQLPFIGFKDGAALTEMIVRKEGATTDFPIAVMAHAAGAPGVSSDAAGKGAFYYDTTNDALYLQVNT